MIRKGSVHYAWVICIAGLWLFLCNMGLCSNILTIYLPFIEATGISGGAGSSILSIRCLFSFITTFFVGVYYRKLSLRRGILMASLVGAAAALIFAVGGGPAVYFAGAALAGIAYGAGSVYPVSLLMNRWFSTRLGLALGISSAGSGLATMVLSPLLTSVIQQFSLRTAFLLQAGFMTLSAVIVFLLIRDTPADMGLMPYGVGKRTASGSARSDAGELSKTMLGLLAVMMLLNGGAGLAFSGHISVLAVTSGYGVETAAKVVSLFGLTLMFGKLVSGGIADRIGAKKCSVLLIAIFDVGCLCVFGMDGTRMLWCFALACFLGFGASAFNVGPPLWAADFSSAESYPKTLRWMQIFYNFGGIVFTVVPGLIADHTGEYKSSYLLFAGMMAVSTAILLFVYHGIGKAPGKGRETVVEK